MSDMDAILDLTPSDYRALLRGYRLRRADNKQSELEYEILRNKLTATDAKGKKPKYKMKEIFDYEKEVKDIMNEEAPKKVSEETIRNFRDSKAYAEQVLNARRQPTATGRTEGVRK